MSLKVIYKTKTDYESIVLHGIKFFQFASINGENYLTVWYNNSRMPSIGDYTILKVYSIESL